MLERILWDKPKYLNTGYYWYYHKLLSIFRDNNDIMIMLQKDPYLLEIPSEVFMNEIRLLVFVSK